MFETESASTDVEDQHTKTFENPVQSFENPVADAAAAAAAAAGGDGGPVPTAPAARGGPPTDEEWAALREDVQALKTALKTESNPSTVMARLWTTPTNW